MTAGQQWVRHLWEEPLKALSRGDCAQWRSCRQVAPGGLKGEAARGDLRSCAAAALWRRRHRQWGSGRALQQTSHNVSRVSARPALLLGTTAKALHESTGMLQTASLLNNLHRVAAGCVRLAEGEHNRVSVSAPRICAGVMTWSP